MEVAITIIVMSIIGFVLWSIGNNSDKLIESWKR